MSHFVSVTEFDSHDVTFLLNQPFHDGVSDNLCSRPRPALIECSVSWQQWKLRTRMYFSAVGMISEHTNLNAGISSNKTYDRVKVLLGQTTIDPFAITEDPAPVTDVDWFAWE